MNNFTYLLAALILISIGFTADANIEDHFGKISGKIVDTQKRPLDFVKVSLLKLEDSSVVNSTTTDKGGNFTINGIETGTYILYVTQIGFEKKYSKSITVSANNLSYDSGIITLNPERKQLKEVFVTAQKPLIEHKGDKVVMNVSANSASAGSSALEVLQNAPGVSVDKDDNIALKGRQGVLIMIDGKQTYMSSADLANMLRNMQSDELETIEIINNPSAKYEADGKSGIINIRLKKNKGYGTNGTLTASLGYSGYRKSNGGLNINNRSKNINFFGSYNYNNNKGEQVLDIDRVNNFQGVESVFNQTGKGERYWYNHNFKVGADYSLSKKTTIGALSTGYINTWNERFGNQTFIHSPAGSIDSTVQTKNDSRSSYRNLTYNLNYKTVIDTNGKEISVDLDFASNYSNDRTDYDNIYQYVSEGKTINELLKNQTPARIKIYALKIDYVHPLKKGFKIETGYKSSWVKTDNDFQFTRFINNEWKNDITRSNHFIYDENINAAYLNFRKEYKKLTIQSGLRAEQTNSKGNLVTTGSVVKRNYIDLFPSAAITYSPNDNTSFGLTYSRRISRPRYDALNPFEYYLDKYTFNKGNPFLKPEYANTFELSYTLLKKYTISAGFAKTTDVITDVLLASPEKSALYQTNANLAEQLSYTLNMSLPISISKWWNTNTNITLFNNQFKSPNLNGQVLNNNQTAFQVNSNQNFRVNPKLSIDLNGNYQSKIIYGTFQIKPQYRVDFGLSQSFAAKRVNMKLAVNDVFKTRESNIRSALAALNYKVHQHNDSRVVRLTVAYKFGSNEIKPNRNRSTGLDAEAGRLKN